MEMEEKRETVQMLITKTLDLEEQKSRRFSPLTFDSWEKECVSKSEISGVFPLTHC